MKQCYGLIINASVVEVLLFHAEFPVVNLLPADAALSNPFALLWGFVLEQAVLMNALKLMKETAAYTWCMISFEVDTISAFN